MPWHMRAARGALWIGILLTFLLAAESHWDVPQLALAVKAATAVGVFLFVWAVSGSSASFVWSHRRQSAVAIVSVGPRIALVVLAAAASYVAWRLHVVSWIAATVAILYVVARLVTHPRLGQWRFSRRVVVDDSFAAGKPLGRRWDEVRRGTVRMIWAEDGLRVGWAAGGTYSSSGYLLKKLPAVPLRVEADIEPRLYGMGWDPGMHFYAEEESDYSMSIGLVPAGSGPAPHSAVNGISVRTGYWKGGWEFLEHTRVFVPPGQVTHVVVDLRPGHASVTIGDESLELGFTRPLTELVVGAVKWNKDPPEVWPAGGEHFVRHVRVARL